MCKPRGKYQWETSNTFSRARWDIRLLFLFATMLYCLMPFEVPFLVSAEVAHIALIRSLSGVTVTVPFHHCWVLEHLATHRTLVYFLLPSNRVLCCCQRPSPSSLQKGNTKTMDHICFHKCPDHYLTHWAREVDKQMAFTRSFLTDVSLFMCIIEI